MGQKKAELYFSNAVWSEAGRSSDSHDSFEMAKGVCLKLLWDHENIPCPIRGYCEKVMVTDKNGYLLYEQLRENKFIPSYKQTKTRR